MASSSGIGSAARVLRPGFSALSIPAERVVLGAIIAYALGVRLLLVFVVPPWQGPDEPKHFEYARRLIDLGDVLIAERRLLDPSDGSPDQQAAIIRSMAEHRFWKLQGRAQPVSLPADFRALWGGSGTLLHRPSLYYPLGALAILPVSGADLERQLDAIRIVSALLSTACVPLAYALARQVEPNDATVPAIAAAFVAALPMHAFIGATANTDNLSSVVGSIALLAMFRLVGGTVRSSGWIVLGLALAAAFLTKRTAVALLPATLLTLGLWLGRRGNYRSRRVILPFVAVGVLAIGAGALLAMSPAVASRVGQTVLAYALNEDDQANRLLRVGVLSPETRALVGWQISQLFRSFWGIFGWFSLQLSERFYGALLTLSMLGTAGFVVWLVERLRSGLGPRVNGQARNQTAMVAVALSALFSTVVVAMGERLAYFSPAEVPQGRYLFGVVAAIALLFALGMRRVLGRSFFGDRLPVAAVCVCLVAIDATVFLGYLLPAYMPAA